MLAALRHGAKKEVVARMGGVSVESVTQKWPRSFEKYFGVDKWIGCGLKSSGAGLSTAAPTARKRQEAPPRWISCVYYSGRQRDRG